MNNRAWKLGLWIALSALFGYVGAYLIVRTVWRDELAHLNRTTFRRDCALDMAVYYVFLPLGEIDGALTGRWHVVDFNSPMRKK